MDTGCLAGGMVTDFVRGVRAAGRRNIFRKLLFLERPRPRVAGRGRIRRRGCAWSCRWATGARPATATAAGEEWIEIERGGGVGMGRIEILESVHNVVGEIELVLLDAHHDALGELVAAIRGGVCSIGEKLACVSAGGLI